MTTPRSSRTRPPDTTTGSAQRPARKLAASTLVFDLAAEQASLKQEASWQHGDRNARTLLKEAGFRIVLTVIKPGTRIKEHSTEGRATIQTLAGRLRVHLPGQPVDLPVGHLLALDRNVLHDVEALEESAFLLTIARAESGGEPA